MENAPEPKCWACLRSLRVVADQRGHGHVLLGAAVQEGELDDAGAAARVAADLADQVRGGAHRAAQSSRGQLRPAGGSSRSLQPQLQSL